MIETELILAFLIGAITSGIGTAYYIRQKFTDTAKSMAEDEEFQEFMNQTVDNLAESLSNDDGKED